MTSHARPLAVLGAMLVAISLPAGPVQATSAVETARAQERPVDPAVATDPAQAPQSPLAIADQLTPADAGLQIQLRAAEPAPRDASALHLAFDDGSE